MNRRQFLASGASALPLFSKNEKRPNIVVIMADEMGFSDLGCYGSEIATPNLDALAKGGVKFTQFYNTARCCPTRSSLLTGLYSHQAGIGHMVEDRGKPGYQGYLNDRCATIAEVLRPAGYTTLMAGKWHVGERRPHWPTDRGFDRYFGLISGGSNYWKLDQGRQMAMDDKPYKPEPGKFYMTDAFTEHAERFMEESGAKENPFFLYLAYTAPHWPLHAWPEDIAKYRGKYRKGWDRLRQERHERQVAMGLVDKRWPLTPRDKNVQAWDAVTNAGDWDLRMAVYAAQIDRMDQGIGRVVSKLKQMGQLDNTLILFLADNGGCAEENIRGEQKAAAGPVESFTSYGVPWANASNTPFRLYKHWVHEGGISSPLIMHWPRAIRPSAKWVRRPSHLIDIMTTCCEAGGAKYPRNVTPAEGESLLAAVRGQTRRRKPLFWEHEGNRAVRDGDWKLVSRYPGDWELYNLIDDRTEMVNRAAAEPARVEMMKRTYGEWAARCKVLPWDQVRS